MMGDEDDILTWKLHNYRLAVGSVNHEDETG